MEKFRTGAVVASIVVGAMLGGPGGAAAHATESPRAGTPATLTSSVALESRRSAPSGPISVGSPSEPAAPTGDQSTNGIPIGPLINWVKANAPSILTPMKNAVRNGLSSFKSWWNGLAGWIKSGITFIVNCSLTELFNALWNYFFG